MYKLKKNSKDNVERFKARLVVKNYAQNPSNDFDKIFFQVICLITITVVLAIVVVMDLELEQLDIKITFLYDDLDEEIYITQLEGFIGKEKKDLICWLNKSLYGLK